MLKMPPLDMNCIFFTCLRLESHCFGHSELSAKVQRRYSNKCKLCALSQAMQLRKCISGDQFGQVVACG